MHGFLLIDKPAGMTSHDVVDRVRRLTGERTVGHAGTLDPFATGLLIVGIGRTATKEFQKLVGLDKEYEATFAFGAESDTDDRTGKITARGNHPITPPWEGGDEKKRVLPFPRGGSLLAASRQAEGLPTVGQIKDILPTFLGHIKQVPPAYAAIKVGGKKMYEAARAGTPIKAEPRDVRVDAFVMLNEAKHLSTGPSAAPQDDNAVSRFAFRIACSSGTYIRALARDLGYAVGSSAYVEELRRTAVGPFSASRAVPLGALTPATTGASIIPVPALLAALPKRDGSATLPA